MGPFLTFRDKQAVAERYRDGEGMPQIAASYGCVVSVIERALRQLGVERRSAQEAQALVRARHREDAVRRCRECGAGCEPNAVRPLCVTCKPRFCQDCDLPLSHGGTKKTNLCPGCKFRARYQKKEPRLCRICGRMGARGTKRDLCNVHIGWFCKGCDQAIPPTRVNKNCPLCEREKKERLWAKPDRVCCQCGEREAKLHSSRCQTCVREEYEVRRWAALHLDRPCVQCGTTLARGRVINRCTDCHRKRQKQRRKERQALGAHRCAMCHEPLPLTRDTYCGGCGQMIANWRAAWHREDSVARQLGTVRTHRKWQAAGQQQQEERAA